MIELMLKILTLAAIVFVWGFVWVWASDRDNDIFEKQLEDANGIKGEHTAIKHPQPKREWVGLTHEEIDYQAKKDNHGVYFALGALWAEAKLKEKNT